MANDAHANFCYSTVATAPSPATSGTSVTVQSADASAFPNPAVSGQYNLVVWPTNSSPTNANAEIVRVTAKASATLTIVRVQEASVARSVVVGDQIAMTVTKKTLTDIETFVNTIGGNGTFLGSASGAPVWSNVSSFGASPPASPGDGQLWTLPASATSGILWTFRYNAGSASAYKWEFWGGTPLIHAIDTLESTASTSYADLATVGPTLTAPRSGEYSILYQSTALFNGGWTGSGSQVAYASISIAGVAAISADALGGTTIDTTGEYDSYHGPFSRRMTKTLTAGDVVIMKYTWNGSNGGPAFSFRRLELVPIRVS